MELKLIDYDEGSMSTVFFDRIHKKAYKVFKSYESLDKTDKRDFDEEEYNKWKKNIYKTEIDAYYIISNSSVKKYFSQKYNDFNINKISDSNGSDISNQYLLDCIIKLDLIEGTSFKQNDSRVIHFCEEHNIDLQGIFSELTKIGVNFYEDSSVFLKDNEIKIIDIATTHYSEFQPELLV
jgi:hypothetical protein